jgi:hypothetical protein
MNVKSVSITALDPPRRAARRITPKPDHTGMFFVERVHDGVALDT